MKNEILLICLSITLFTSACAQGENPAEQAHKDQIVIANEEMLNQGNLDFAEEVFTDDYAGRGPEMIKEYVSKMRTAFPDLQVKIDLLLAEGNMTAWRRTHTGTHQDTYWGFPPSGKKISWEDFVISRYEDGKVAEEWGAGNLYEVLQKESAGAYKPDEVIAVANSIVDALNKKDAATYDGYLHSTFTLFLPQSAVLLKGNDPVAQQEDFQKGMQFDIQLKDLEVAFYGNTAIVTGYETGIASFVNGDVLDGKRKYSSVWIREGNQWKEVHLHISGVE